MSEKEERSYIAIDLKSFYASVECMERHLDPLTTNLVVADVSRTEKTICLAVSPSLKKYGISGRARLFEVVQKIKEVNALRRRKINGRRLEGKSVDSIELSNSPELEVSYIAAPPRMSLYIDYSTRIYSIYLKYVAPEDIHVYSIDEVFMDVTDYLETYNMTAQKLAEVIIKNVLEETGITATAGIGSNLYRCKVAMDIVAKHVPADKYGVRIAQLNEISYRRLLWNHRPITDFWRVGRGYAAKLEANGLYTMGDIARCSIGKEDEYYNEELLYKLFGINAELLIDHAWGYEPCTIADVKSYKPENNSLSQGQVLQCPYSFDKALIVLREMTENLVLDLVDKTLVTDQMVLTIGYDTESLKDKDIRKNYKGEITTDQYGRKIPKHAHGTVNIGEYTSSTKRIMECIVNLYSSITDKDLLIRRINVVANHVVNEKSAVKNETYEQMELFTDYDQLVKEREKKKTELEKEKKLQLAMLNIKKKFGKNAILKGINFEEGATGIQRNNQIGGHKA